MFLDQLLGGFLTATAAGAQATALGQMSDMHRALFHGFADFCVSNGFAEAHVHWFLEAFVRLGLFKCKSFSIANGDHSHLHMMVILG